MMGRISIYKALPCFEIGWGMQPLVPIICHPYFPLHFEEMPFYTLVSIQIAQVQFQAIYSRKNRDALSVGMEQVSAHINT